MTTGRPCRGHGARIGVAARTTTFFGGSTEKALVALPDIRPGELTDAERRRLKQLIDVPSRGGR
jgi:hypothetical protein